MKVVRSATFDRWLRKLNDRRAAARVLVRIERLAAGNPGDVKPVGHGVSELRIDYGPGYRVYYLQRGSELIVLLCGGDKSSQADDIDAAAVYLEAALEEAGDDPAFVAHALGTIARSGNVSELARRTGMSREGLYKALSADGNPSFATIVKVARALGLRIRFTPAA